MLTCIVCGYTVHLLYTQVLDSFTALYPRIFF